ncbi:hypothetical protein V5O48_008309 [Marasmius crinis-equi]|uniref:Major facilitator superfamily (MFS) profile domain-containing protein n=1 Tax=Marasmius crinis-equi TaxID=585013 RepID=A0ABR3FEE4_9AGAR
MVFVAGCLDFTLGACLNVPLAGRLSFGKIIAYSIQSAAPPFPVFVIAYAIDGVGIALQEAQANSFVATLKKHSEVKMSLTHSFFGLGAFIVPLVVTRFVQLQWHWSFFFLISLGFAVINTTLLAAVFKLQPRDRCLAETGQPVIEKGCPVAEEDRQDDPSRKSFRQILSHPGVYLLAAFLFMDIGVNATIGGWMVTFLKRERHGGARAGYVSSGFFGGLTLGSVALLWFNTLVGERYATLVYTVLAIGLEFIVWCVPSFIGNAIVISFIGFFLGPLYPLAMNHAGRTLPREILSGSIGLIAGFGQMGGAVYPSVAGTLTERFGIARTLHPMLISMIAALAVLWGIINMLGRAGRH